MKKSVYEQKARECGVNNCIYFNWSYKVKNNCWLSDKLTPCIQFNGQKCENYEESK